MTDQKKANGDGSPLDLLPQERWAELLRELSEELGMVATLVDSQGKILVHVGDYTDVCIRVRNRPESLTFVCGQTSQALMKQAEKTGQPVVDLCQIGLCKMIIPLFREKVLLGAVAACSRALAGEDLDPFMVAQELGISEKEAEELLGSAPQIHEEKLWQAAGRWIDRIRNLAALPSSFPSTG
jgi:ligand-binding sensor protein